MVKVEFQGKEFYMDGYVKSNLDDIIKSVRQDKDAIILITGRERSGKSVFGMQCAAYCDAAFGFDKIAFSSREFREKTLGAKKYSAIVWDEALSGVRGVNWSHNINKGIVQMLSEIGQLNLIIFIVCPNFFEFNKYIAIHRAIGLLHTYFDDVGNRGGVIGWGWNAKKKLYLMGKPFYNYNAVRGEFTASFTNYYPLNEQKYRSLKYAALKDAGEDKEPPVVAKMRGQRDGVLCFASDTLKISDTQLTNDLKPYLDKDSLGRRQISSILQAKKGGV